MKLGFLKELIRRDWYLLLILVVVVVVAAYKIGTSRNAESTGQVGVEGGGPGGISANGAGPQLQPRRKLTAQEKAVQLVQQYQEELNAEPTGERAPALLSAMGNLYSRELKNDKEAVRCFEQILYDFPNWEANRGVYVKLAACYERLGDINGARQVYRDMMRVFGEDTQEYAYAKAQLEGKEQP